MKQRPWISSTLAAALQSLAECQLQAQTSRSGALDAGAAGVMGVDSAIAASVLALRSAGHLWIAALALLLLSLVLAASSLLMEGADHIGPMVDEIIADCEDRSSRDLEGDLLRDLAARVTTNQAALARKEPRLVLALAVMLLAIVVEIAVQVH